MSSYQDAIDQRRHDDRIAKLEARIAELEAENDRLWVKLAQRGG